ncbi:fibronectin type III domain protein, partial [Ancylostoma duodenale]
TLVDVTEAASIKQDDGKKKKRKKKPAKREKVEVKVTPSDEHDEGQIQRRAPTKTELLEVNISRKRTLSGNSEIYVEIDIEAGEETAKTDALIDLNFYDFDESNLSVSGYGTEEIEVDVFLDSIDEEDGVDAFALTNAAQINNFLSKMKPNITADAQEELRRVERCITVTNKIKSVKEGEVPQKIVRHPQPTEWKDLKDIVVLSCTTEKIIEHASWFKNGMKVETNEFISIETEEKESRITLKKFNPFYIGVYHVVVDGIGSQPAQVSANIAPILETELPSNIVHRIGKPLDLRLPYTAYPVPQVKLRHKNAAVTLIADIDQYEDAVSIRIKNLKKEDEGDIQISLSNDFGKAETSFTLQLVDTPLAPRNAHIVKLTPTDVTLEWESPDNDEENVIHYVVERRTAESRRWRKITKTTEKTYTCSDLIPREFYAFRILAVNEYGEGIPSNAVEVDMPSEEEEDQVQKDIPLEELPEEVKPIEELKPTEEEKPIDELKPQEEEKPEEE